MYCIVIVVRQCLHALEDRPLHGVVRGQPEHTHLIEEMNKEACMLARMDHDSIVKFYGIVYDAGTCPLSFLTRARFCFSRPCICCTS